MENKYEMVAGVVGNGDVDEESLEALLDWFLPDESLVEIATDAKAGLDRVFLWCSEVDQESYRNRSEEHIIETLVNYQDIADEVTLIVLGVEGSEKIIEAAWFYDIEVFDLTRAMYPVTKGDDLDLVVYEPQTQPHEVSDGLGGRGSLEIFAPQNRSGDAVEATPKDYMLIKELEEKMAAMIKTHEESHHALQYDRQPAAIIADTADEGQVRYLLTEATGDLKKAPRAKPKAGERVVYRPE